MFSIIKVSQGLKPFMPHTSFTPSGYEDEWEQGEAGGQWGGHMWVWPAQGSTPHAKSEGLHLKAQSPLPSASRSLSRCPQPLRSQGPCLPAHAHVCHAEPNTELSETHEHTEPRLLWEAEQMPSPLSAKGETEAQPLNSSNIYGKRSLCCACALPLKGAKRGHES